MAKPSTSACSCRLSRMAGRLFCFGILALCPSMALSAEARTSLVAAHGDILTEVDKEAVMTFVAREQSLLQARLAAFKPQTTPGQLKVTLGELTARMLYRAMHSILVVKPRGNLIILGIFPQEAADKKGPSLALYDLSRWANEGRTLDANHTGKYAVEVLYESSMLSEAGDQFTVSNVPYRARFINGNFRFTRVAGQ